MGSRAARALGRWTAEQRRRKIITIGTSIIAPLGSLATGMVTYSLWPKDIGTHLGFLAWLCIVNGVEWLLVVLAWRAYQSSRTAMGSVSPGDEHLKNSWPPPPRL